ncbi:hypothetical protein ACHMW4_13815 [Mesorhizobium sp. UC22_110]|uniref:hypothetical protein n=1 Tax=Mesorhizobium sp. UC22_110 TaxID=3374552 RepID=UPI0037574C9B
MAGNTRFEILDGGEALALDLPDKGRRRFHAIWLRDNAGTKRPARRGTVSA